MVTSFLAQDLCGPKACHWLLTASVNKDLPALCDILICGTVLLGVCSVPACTLGRTSASLSEDEDERVQSGLVQVELPFSISVSLASLCRRTSIPTFPKGYEAFPLEDGQKVLDITTTSNLVMWWPFTISWSGLVGYSFSIWYDGCAWKKKPLCSYQSYWCLCLCCLSFTRTCMYHSDDLYQMWCCVGVMMSCIPCSVDTDYAAIPAPFAPEDWQWSTQ